MPRRAFDYYETPPHYIEPLLDELVHSVRDLRVYEPCVGQGHIARYLTDAGTLTTNDINPDCPATLHQDARTADAWPAFTIGAEPWPFDWVITNPPFSDELAILKRALNCSKNVAFLARLSFLEPTLERGQFWLDHSPSDVIVLPRYSFRLNDAGKRQTDNVTCCWLVWRFGRAGLLRWSIQRQRHPEPLSLFNECDEAVAR